MKARPILFSGEMVRAILAGTKTQTRRIAKFFDNDEAMQFDPRFDGGIWKAADYGYECKCPYGVPGDRLWVRETFAVNPHYSERNGQPKYFYRADGPEYESDGAWKPSIFMPRWASRFTLEITDVRVQRLHDIGRDGRKAHDVLAEGITDAQIEHWRKWLHPDDAPAHTYGVLWDSINGKGSWQSNPWVWAITFKKVSP